MQASWFVGVLLLSGLALCQSNPPVLTANKLTHDGPLLRASGHVQVKIAGVILEADEGVQNPEKQTIDLRGHVLVRLPASHPAWIIRAGAGGVIVATDPPPIAADELTATAAKLHARGHIQVKRDFTVWQADEADFYLNAGEAEFAGNILVNGVSPVPVTRLRRFGEFSTPEIIK